MNNKEFKKKMAYEALTLLGLLALLCFVTRLWPILLLAILGIFIAVIRLLYLNAEKTEPEKPVPALPPAIHMQRQTDLEAMAFMLVERRITQILCEQYPEVRWIWENSRAREDLFAGKELYVLLNRAAGYRRAKVIVRELQVFDVVIQQDPVPVKKDIIESTAADQKADETENEDSSEEQAEEETTEAQPVSEDFGLLAFQWVDHHIIELSGRCNEAIAEGLHELKIPEEELPVRESWEEICRELARNELPDAETSGSGILIKF